MTLFGRTEPLDVIMLTQSLNIPADGADGNAQVRSHSACRDRIICLHHLQDLLLTRCEHIRCCFGIISTALGDILGDMGAALGDICGSRRHCFL